MQADTGTPVRAVGFFLRGAAFVIDVIVCSVIGAVVGLLLARLFALPPEAFPVYARPFACLIYVSYFAVEAVWGITAGKLAFGLRVLDRSGLPPRPKARIWRYAAKTSMFWLRFAAILLASPFLSWLSSGAAAVIFLLGSTFLLSDERSTIHDEIAGTIVAKRLPSKH